jgi:hypothetical protein
MNHNQCKVRKAAMLHVYYSVYAPPAFSPSAPQQKAALPSIVDPGPNTEAVVVVRSTKIDRFRATKKKESPESPLSPDGCGLGW